MSLSPRELEEAKAALRRAVEAGQIVIPAPQSQPGFDWSGYYAERRRKRREQGLCSNCGRKRDRIDKRTGKTALKCSTCHQSSVASKALRIQRTKDGCSNCGRKRDRVNRRTGKPTRWCGACLDSHARSKRKRKALHVSPTP